MEKYQRTILFSKPKQTEKSINKWQKNNPLSQMGVQRYERIFNATNKSKKKMMEK